jgi:hypothetical protein
MKHIFMALLFTVGSASLVGCSIFDKDLGSSVATNTKAQVVDPYAGHGETVATLDGQKAEKLLKEYRKEKAAAPTERLLTEIAR